MNSLLKAQGAYAKKQFLTLVVIFLAVSLSLLFAVASIVYGALLIGVIAIAYLIVISIAKSYVNAAVEKYQTFKFRIDQVIAGNVDLNKAKQLQFDMRKPLHNELDKELSDLISNRYECVKKVVKNLTKKNYSDRLSNLASVQKKAADLSLDKRLENHPLTKVKVGIETSLRKLKARRAELQGQWDDQFEQLSWWGKLSHMDGPDFSQLNSHIYQLSEMLAKFNRKYQPILDKLKKDFIAKKKLAHKRIDADLYSLKNYVNSQSDIAVLEKHKPDYMLKVVGWCGAFGLGYSLWDDFITSHAVYDVLRGVNGNFANMSDIEIWYETLWMSDASLVGLTSLTKGAYLEQLVESNTGGELFEHFNNPGTDIIIGGVEYQIKATDSVEYIESVDEGVPVIATSEVAELTGAIDAGFTNAELTEDVALALGGSGVDIVDGVTDGIIAGLGGLGTFATLRGIYAANKQYESGTPGEEAVFNGLEVAVTGTAKAVVDISEMAYKVTTSRPSRFVGRSVLKLTKKIVN